MEVNALSHVEVGYAFGVLLACFIFFGKKNVQNLLMEFLSLFCQKLRNALHLTVEQFLYLRCFLVCFVSISGLFAFIYGSENSRVDYLCGSIILITMSYVLVKAKD